MAIWEFIVTISLSKKSDQPISHFILIMQLKDKPIYMESTQSGQKPQDIII